MLVLRLALRALGWRAAASATVFVVALIGIMAAAVGPIYLHAVNDSVLSERLIEAPQADRDINISWTTTNQAGIDWHGPVEKLARQAADPRWFDRPVFSEEAQVTYRHSIRYASQLAAIDGFCTHVRVVSGRCLDDSASDETVISARTASAQHLKVGDLVDPIPVANATPIRLRVVGVVAPIAVSGAFWQPWDLFNATPAVFDNQLPRLDSFFVSHLALASRLETVIQTLAVNVHLRPAAVHLDSLPALRDHAQRIKTDAVGANPPGAADISVGSQLADVLNGMNREMSLARTLIILPTAQLVLLAIFVLYAVVAGTTAVQGPEVALAKLRGRRPRSVLLQGVVQPIVLIAVAAPVAAVLAWLVIAAVADRLLGRHVDVVFPTSAAEVVAAAAGGGIVAATIAARRIVVSPVGALLRRGTDTSGSSLGVALADAAAVTLALAGLVELIAGGVLDSGQTDPLSALAPTLLAVAGAIVVLRLVPFAGRLVVRWTRDSRRLASFLAVRQIVRRPAGARVVLLIGVALALATFAVLNWSVARTNRQVRALDQAGASTVLDVLPSPAVIDLRRAVDRADPGRHSMAAAVVQVQQSTPLLAVDTTRFAGVAAWSTNNSGAPLPTVLAALRRGAGPSIALTGSDVRLDLDLTKAPARTALDLNLYVTDAAHRRYAYDLGRPRPGRGTYAMALAPECAAGCRITGLTLQPDDPTSVVERVDGRLPEIDAVISAEVRSGGVWQPVAGFTSAARWRDDGAAAATISGAAGGLSVTLAPTVPQGPWPELLSADAPAHLPALLASGTASTYPGPSMHDVSGFGMDEAALPLDGVHTAVTLPEVDRYGEMVDFGLALSVMSTQPGAATHFQVWLAPEAPPDMASRLERQGIRVIDVVHAGTFRSALDHSGPAFADGLFLVAAAAATLLAIGATVLGGIITARRRAYELAALEVAGVPRRTLRRASAGEQGILLAVGLLVGVGAGLGGSALALPSTPFFVDDSVGPPTQDNLPFGLLGILVGALIVAFAITSWIVARLVSRQATAGRLREAQQ